MQGRLSPEKRGWLVLVLNIACTIAYRLELTFFGYSASEIEYSGISFGRQSCGIHV
jgi:hypothetical protein